MQKGGKNNEIPRVEDWIIRLTVLAEMVKLTGFFREISPSMILKVWKTCMEFLTERKKTELMISGSGN